jgi:hypothetical protein
MFKSFASSRTHLLRFCQHTRLVFLARNLPPDVMIRPADASFNPGHGDILQRSSNCFCPGSHTGLNCTRHSSTGPGSHCDTLSAHELAWYRVIVELPHHSSPRDCLAWQSFTARLLTWFLGWVRCLMPPNGLLVRILLQIPTLETALPFKPSNSFTITC